VALLSGIALSPELQDRYGRHLKNCDPVSVVRVRSSLLFGEPSSSRFPHVRSACTVLLRPSLAGTVSAPLAGTLLLLTIAGTFTAEWHSSLGGSPRPHHPPLRFTLRSQTLRLGYAVSWYSTTSLAHAKIRKRRRLLGTVRPRPACHCSSLGLEFTAFPLRRPATVVLSSLSVGTWCCKILTFCFGGPAEGFVSFPGFISILVFPYVSGGGYCSVLPSS